MPIAEGKQIWFNGNNSIREVQTCARNGSDRRVKCHTHRHIFNTEASLESVCSISQRKSRK